MRRLAPIALAGAAVLALAPVAAAQDAPAAGSGATAPSQAVAPASGASGEGNAPVASDAAQGPAWTLSTAIEKAVTSHPVVAAARAGVDEFEAKLTAAELAWLPRLSSEGYVSGTPTKEGNPLVGHTDYDQWGPYASFEMSGIMPIFTFGKISSLKDMASAGVDVGNAQVQIAQLAVETMVVQAYTSLQFAGRMTDILGEGEKYLARARKYLEKLRDEDSQEFDDVDMLRLKVYESEVSSRRLDTARMKRVALAALMLLTGQLESSFEPMPAAAPYPVELALLDEYIATALQRRGEMAVLLAAQRAQDARVSLETARFFPDLFIGGFVSIAKAWAIEEQPSPFAYDPYNSWFAGAGLGLKWDFALGDRIGGLDEQRATARKLAAQQEALGQKITIEVVEAFQELKDLQEKIVLDRKAYKAAQGWLIARMDLYESGMAEMRDLSDALTEFFKRKGQYESTVMTHNVAVARLAHACGQRLQDLTKIE
jgi:outer membrane protein TolC